MILRQWKPRRNERIVISSSKDFGFLRQIIVEINNLGTSKWRKDRLPEYVSDETKSLYDDIRTRRPPYEKKELKRKMDDSGNSFETGRKAIHLPPLKINSEFVPIMELTINLENDPIDINYRIWMFTPTSDSENDFDFRQIGFRFESPHTESPDDRDESSHNFWHMQITPPGEVESNSCLPDKIPCLPVRITNSVSFLLYTLICFYGKKYHRKLFSKGQIDDEYIAPLKNIFGSDAELNE